MSYVPSPRLRVKTREDHPRSFFTASNWQNGQPQELLGFTSSRAIWDYNNSDRHKRAEAIEQYLIQTGYKGFAQLDPWRFTDWGGPFELLSQEFSQSPVHKVNLEARNANGTYNFYMGEIFAGERQIDTNSPWLNNNQNSLSGFKGRIGKNFSDLDQSGTKAMSRSARNKPRAALSNALLELRSMNAPILRKSAVPEKELRALRGGGAQEYLRLLYGIIPTFGDVKQMLDSALKADALMKALIEGANQPMRRSYKFPDVASTTSTVGGTWAGTPVMATNLVKKYGTMTTITSTSKRTWFSGKAIYGYPLEDDLVGRIQRLGIEARYLYGLDLTPETIWNAIPWSWFVDWFLNIGDLMSCLTSATWDGNVWMYAYIMEEEISRKRVIMNGFVDVFGVPRDHTQSFTIRRMRRSKATPFGFGLTESGLSLNQIATLSALKASYGGKH